MLDSAEEQDLDDGMESVDVETTEAGYPAAIQSLAARRRRGVSKRKLAFLSPRLGVLNNIPQTVRIVPPSLSRIETLTLHLFVGRQIPFEVRVEIFRAFIR